MSCKNIDLSDWILPCFVCLLNNLTQLRSSERWPSEHPLDWCEGSSLLEVTSPWSWVYNKAGWASQGSKSVLVFHGQCFSSCPDITLRRLWPSWFWSRTLSQWQTPNLDRWSGGDLNEKSSGRKRVTGVGLENYSLFHFQFSLSLRCLHLSSSCSYCHAYFCNAMFHLLW